jgi:hypothetical protein
MQRVGEIEWEMGKEEEGRDRRSEEGGRAEYFRSCRLPGTPGHLHLRVHTIYDTVVGN